MPVDPDSSSTGGAISVCARRIPTGCATPPAEVEVVLRPRSAAARYAVRELAPACCPPVLTAYLAATRARCRLLPDTKGWWWKAFADLAPLYTVFELENHCGEVANGDGAASRMEHAWLSALKEAALTARSYSTPAVKKRSHPAGYMNPIISAGWG